MTNVGQLGSAEGGSSSSDEGEYETKMESSYGGKEKGDVGGGGKGRGKVCSCPELTCPPALNGSTVENETQCYALELAFRSRKSVCVVETIEYHQQHQVFSRPSQTHKQNPPRSRLKSSAQ